MMTVISAPLALGPMPPPSSNTRQHAVHVNRCDSDRCWTPWKMAPPDAHLCTYCVKEHTEGLHIGSLRLIQPYRFQSSLWSYDTPSHLSFFRFCKQMWKIDMHYTWKHPIQTNRYTSPAVSLPFVPLPLLCWSCYLQICWGCHSCIGHTHTHKHHTQHVQRALWGKYIWRHHAWSFNHD